MLPFCIYFNQAGSSSFICTLSRPSCCLLSHELKLAAQKCRLYSWVHQLFDHFVFRYLSIRILTDLSDTMEKWALRLAFYQKALLKLVVSSWCCGWVGSVQGPWPGNRGLGFVSCKACFSWKKHHAKPLLQRAFWKKALKTNISKWANLQFWLAE